MTAGGRKPVHDERPESPVAPEVHTVSPTHPAPLELRVLDLEAALEAASVEIERQKAARHAIAQQLVHYRELFDFAPLPVLILNRAGIIERANPFAAGMLGALPATLEGRPLHAYVEREDTRTLLEHMRRCRAGDTPARAEVVLCASAERASIPVEIHSHSRDGDADHVYTTLTDLSDRQQAEVERQKALEAEAATQTKDRFLATLSHELRTPLAPIVNLIEVLQMRNDLPEAVGPLLEMMARNVWMQVRLIDDLLDVTRIGNGKLTLQPEPVDLHAVLRNVEDMMSADFREARVTLVLELNAQSAALQADTTRINQVFWNILKNALKFTPADGRVSIRTMNPAPDLVRVLIEDSGQGMDADQLTRIFQPFEQAHSGYRKGLGLGLAIARGIVQAHGGQIAAHSDGLEQGSLFAVTLPLAH